MALTLDASSPALVTKTATGTTLVTASFTAPANALLVAFVGYDSSGVNNDQSFADSGGLTWTNRGRKSRNTGSTGGTGQEAGVEVWTAVTATSAARTVTATQAVAKHGALAVKVLTDTGGAPTAGAITGTSSASGLPTANVTTTATNSWVWATSSDWSQKGLGTAGSNQGITDEFNPSGFITLHVWRQNATTSASSTAVTMNLSAPAAQQYNELAFEVKANAAAASGLPELVMAPRR